MRAAERHEESGEPRGEGRFYVLAVNVERVAPAAFALESYAGEPGFAVVDSTDTSTAATFTAGDVAGGLPREARLRIAAGRAVGRALELEAAARGGTVDRPELGPVA